MLKNPKTGNMNISLNQSIVSRSYCRYDFPNKDVNEFIQTAKIMSVVVVGGFALFGNVLIVLLAAKYTVRKNIHYMIINMALSDIFVVLMFSSRQIQSTSSHGIFYNIYDQITVDILCKVGQFCIHSVRLVTLVNLLIISVERFRATRLTVHRALPHSRKTHTALVLGSWLLPMALSAYNLYFWKSLYFKNWKYYRCFFFVQYALVWSTIPIVFVVIFVLIILVLGTLTLRSLSSSENVSANLSTIQQRRRSKRMAGAVKMVLCSLLLYICSYLTTFSCDLYWIIHTNHIRSAVAIDAIDWVTLEFVADFLLLVNSCFSPCIYIVFLKDFREAAKLLLFGRPSQEPKATDATELGNVPIP